MLCNYGLQAYTSHWLTDHTQACVSVHMKSVMYIRICMFLFPHISSFFPFLPILARWRNYLWWPWDLEQVADEALPTVYHPALYHPIVNPSCMVQFPHTQVSIPPSVPWGGGLWWPVLKLNRYDKWKSIVRRFNNYARKLPPLSDLYLMGVSKGL